MAIFKSKIFKKSVTEYPNKPHPSNKKTNVSMPQKLFNSLFKNLKIHCKFDLKALNKRANERIKKDDETSILL